MSDIGNGITANRSVFNTCANNDTIYSFSQSGTHVTNLVVGDGGTIQTAIYINRIYSNLTCIGRIIEDVTVNQYTLSIGTNFHSIYKNTSGRFLDFVVLNGDIFEITGSCCIESCITQYHCNTCSSG